MTKVGNGTLTLTADNTYSGTTTISTGNLSVGNVTGSATGSGSVHVMGTATTVSGTGIISPAGGGSVIFANGATLSVGRAGDVSAKTFTITPSSGTISTEFQNGSTLEVDLFSGAGLGDNTGNASAADVFQFGGSFTLGSGVRLRVNNPTGMSSFAAGDVWKLLDWSTLGGSAPSGSFDATLLELPALDNLTWNTSQLYTTGTISVVAAPEPSRALLLMLGLTTFVLRRRR